MTATTPADHMRTCERCGLRYDWRKSPSALLKMTYCGSLCERGALGYTLEALVRGTIIRQPGVREFLPTFPSWPIAA